MGCQPEAVVIIQVHKYEIKITLIWSKDLRNIVREGYMRSMQWQLGVLGTTSAFAYRHRETKKCVPRFPVAGPSEYWLLASSPASKVWQKELEAKISGRNLEAFYFYTFGQKKKIPAFLEFRCEDWATDGRICTVCRGDLMDEGSKTKQGE